MKTAMFGF